MGLAPALVHDRLHRAHDQLRQRLERRFGSRSAMALALGALIGEDASPLTSSPAKRAAPRAPKLASPIGVGAMLLVVAVVALVIASRERPREVDATGAQVTAAAAFTPPGPSQSGGGAESAIAPASTGPDSRAPVGGEAAGPLQASFPVPTFEFELEVTVLDDLDRTRAHQALYAAPAGGTLNYVGETDVDGRCKLSLRGWAAAAELDLSLGDDSDGGVRRIALRAGVQSLVLRSPALAAPSSSDLPLLVRMGERAGPVAQIAEQSAYAIRNGPAASRDSEGRLTFFEPRLAHTPSDNEGELSQFEEEFEASVGFSLSVANGFEVASSPTRAALSGTVVDDAGVALGGAVVSLRRADQGEWNTVLTDEHGAYEFETLAPGEWILQAGGGDTPRTQWRLNFVAGATAQWHAQLERGDVLEGLLLDSQRRPLEGWTVEFEGSDAADFARTDEKGRFEIPNAPRGALRLLARPLGLGGAPPIVAAPSAHAADGSRAHVLAISSDELLGELRIALPQADLGASRSCEVRVWRVESECGVLAQWIDASQGQRSARALLAPGEYRVELLVGGREPELLHSVFIAAGAVLELPATASRGSAVEFVGPARSEPMQPVLLRRGACFDTLAPLDSLEARIEELRPGTYSLWNALNSRKLADFTLEPGEPLQVELDAATRR